MLVNLNPNLFLQDSINCSYPKPLELVRRESNIEHQVPVIKQCSLGTYFYHFLFLQIGDRQGPFYTNASFKYEARENAAQ